MELFKMIVFFFDIIITFAYTNTSYLEVTACYNNISTVDMNKNKPRVVDVIIGSVVHLWCNFCDGKEDFYPKLWFYKPRGNKAPKELIIEIETNNLSTNLSMTPFHVLNINVFNENNSGIYTCKSPEVEKGNMFIYILEGVMNVHIFPKVGTSSQWLEYKRNYLNSINKRFKISKEEPFKSLRNEYNEVSFELTTIWDNWGECKEIDQRKGVRKRLGRCRLRPNVNNNTYKAMETFSNIDNKAYLTDGFDIPCRSLKLNKIIPEISKIIRYIPDYEAEEICHVLKKTAVKHKANKDKNKHKTMKEVAENSHVTLLCSEVILNSDLKWFKDEKLLNSLFRNNILSKNEEEPHISVDTNNSLHILHISKNEEGNYSCLVNGKKIQEFEVTVVSKTKLLNQEFIRYSIYLGFVLSLTMTCYCAGVCVAWHRRSSFLDPLNLNKKETHDYEYEQCEREKLLK